MAPQVSLVDKLKSMGKDSSLSARATMAANAGLVKSTQEYIDLAGKGQNADINLKLLDIVKTAPKTATVDGGAPATTTPTTPSAVSNPADANAFINGNQQADFDSATVKSGTGEPPIRTSVKSYQEMFDQLKTSITGGSNNTKPANVSFADTFSTLRTTYGINDLETNLNKLKSDAQAIKDRNQARRFNEEGKAVPMNVIEGRMSEIDKQDTLELNKINREIDLANSELTTKYNIVNNLMNFKKLDYDNAVDSYDKEFTQNLNLFNTIKGIVETQKSDEEKLQDNARANLQIIYNGMSSGAVNYDGLGAEQKANITKLETQAGLPIGFYQSLQNKNPKADILSTTTRENAGGKYADVIMKNPDGSLSTKSIYIGGVSGGGNGDLSMAEQLQLARSKVASQLQPRRGGDGYVAPEDYSRARDAWVVSGLSAEDFDKTFKQYANPESYEKLGLRF